MGLLGRVVRTILLASALSSTWVYAQSCNQAWSKFLSSPSLHSNGSHYGYGQDFGQKLGAKWSEFALSRRAPQGKTVYLVLTHGGLALGEALNASKSIQKIQDVEVIYADINHKVSGAWMLTKATSPLEFEVGYGGVPVRVGMHVWEPVEAANASAEIQTYLKSLGAFSGTKLVVVDGGHYGSVAEAVGLIANQFAERAKPGLEIEGLVFDFAGREHVRGQQIPIHSFNEGKTASEQAIIREFSYLFTYGVTRDQYFGGDHSPIAFQALRPEATALILDPPTGNYVPNTPIYSDIRSDQYRASMRGVWDGVEAAIKGQQP